MDPVRSSVRASDPQLAGRQDSEGAGELRTVSSGEGAPEPLPKSWKDQRVELRLDRLRVLDRRAAGVERGLVATRAEDGLGRGDERARGRLELLPHFPSEQVVGQLAGEALRVGAEVGVALRPEAADSIAAISAAYGSAPSRRGDRSFAHQT